MAMLRQQRSLRDAGVPRLALAAAVAFLLCAAMPVQDRGDGEVPQAPMRAQRSTSTDFGLGKPPSSAAGRAGQRQTRDMTGVTPLARLNGRISNRVQSRISNRIDRNYDPNASTVSSFEAADEQARRAERPQDR